MPAWDRAAGAQRQHMWPGTVHGPPAAATLLPISLLESMNVLAKNAAASGGHGCMAESSTVCRQHSAGHETIISSISCGRLYATHLQ